MHLLNGCAQRFGHIMSYRSISYWFDSLGTDPVPRAPLRGDLEVDVAIVGSAFGISREMTASVNLDPATGIANAGSYVGDGVAASNLTNLLLDRKSALVELPWVGHQSPRWEPEPLRWIGVRTGTAINASADATENRTGRHARLHDVALRILGANLDY
jgi:hypothetical protein